MIPLTEAPLFPPSLLAGSREGLTEVYAALGEAIDAALNARRPAGPLPVGAPSAVLASAAQALGPALLPAEGLGAKAALQLLASLLVEHGIDLSHPGPPPTSSRHRWRSPSPRTPSRA